MPWSLGSRIVALSTAGFLVLTSSAAAASANYPGVIQEHLGMVSQPKCTLCHASNEGGFGTVTTEFGQELTSRGLTAGNANQLRNLLNELQEEGTDVNGDGTPDIEELSECKNPNSTGDDNICLSEFPEASFGCAAHGSSGAPSPWGWVALGAGVFWARRRAVRS